MIAECGLRIAECRLRPLEWLLILLLLAMTMAVRAHADLNPAIITTTNFRDTASIERITGAVRWQGDSHLFSNCVMYAGADTNSPRQDLTDCTITVTAGVAGDTTNFTGYAQDATNGTWWGLCPTILSNNPTYFMYEVVHTNGNDYTYQLEKENTAVKLQ